MLLRHCESRSRLFFPAITVAPRIQLTTLSDDIQRRLNFLACEECSDLQSATYALRVRPLLSTIPPDGTNTVLVGHDDPFEAATGIYPEPMGVTYIIQPQGSEKFEVKAFINPDDWQQLNLK